MIPRLKSTFYDFQVFHGRKTSTSMLLYTVKARSQDLISRVRFLAPKIGRNRSDGPISWSGFFSATFHLKEQCRMKI